MTTHEVEEMLSITKKTLIYYENEGLVKPARDSNNYRNYNQEDVSRIKFILLYIFISSFPFKMPTQNLYDYPFHLLNHLKIFFETTFSAHLLRVLF